MVDTIASSIVRHEEHYVKANGIIRLAATLFLAVGASPYALAADKAVAGSASTVPSAAPAVIAQQPPAAPAPAAVQNGVTAGSNASVPSTSVPNASATSQKPPATGGVSATAPNCSCLAANPDGNKKHKGGPVRHILHGLTKEVGSDLSDMGKDSMFVFSAQDFDPYASKPGRNPKRPYVVGEAEYVDGSTAEIMKFPDRSLRIYGGYADGTYACPISAESSNFVVYYPNGVRGELTLHQDGTAVIKRPDNTTTKITKTNGGYKITNDKLGYMGEINPDTTGLNYEFARSSNPANNLQ
jgi:hypothetical protein